MKGTGAQSALAGAQGNRTGIQASPELAQELIEGAAAAKPSSEGGTEMIEESRGEYIQEGFPIGSLPSLPVAEEAAASEEAAGMAVLLDKLSERLAFERMGTRLYEALINKCELAAESATEPALEQLEQIREEELSHFLLLKRVVTELGGDPTVQSPCADVAGVASLGILQVLTDPRTSVAQCLQAMLTAELTDNDGWELLINLAETLGYQEMAQEFQSALEHEAQHVEQVRGWLAAQVLEKAQA
ncbi:MAG: ferritin-like domain-containing protein [Acidobacteria bacterium]|nr:ferritin-like domain-containing protein [Acidobacteriota bacterium]